MLLNDSFVLSGLISSVPSCYGSHVLSSSNYFLSNSYSQSAVAFSLHHQLSFSFSSVSFSAFCRGGVSQCLHARLQGLISPYGHPKFSPCVILLFPFYDLAVLVGHGLLIFEVSRSHPDTPHSVGILWTSPSQRPLSDNTQLSLPPAGSNPQPQQASGSRPHGQ
jgi:hypothetical protein